MGDELRLGSKCESISSVASTPRQADHGTRWAESVRVLTEMDSWSSSTRYRALQFVPHLRRFFSHVEVSSADDIVERRPGRIGQARYFGTHGVRYVRRAITLRERIAGADALFVQRGLYPMGPATVLRSLGSFDGRIVFDLDDAVFCTSPNLAEKGALAQWLYGPQQALALLHCADAIVVSTAALAELLPDGLTEPVVLATVPDPSAYAVKVPRETAAVTVGWAGTVGGFPYLDPLADVFRRLRASGVAELEVVSSQPWAGPGRFHAWELAAEATVFQRFDIGIMPLPVSEYTRAKAGFKLLQYMASGLPVVASPVGINGELVRQSGAGFLAESPEEWEEAVRVLAADAKLRSDLGLAGRRFVETYADIDGKAAVLASLLHG